MSASGTARGEHGSRADWRTASRESVGLAPLPAEHPEAVVQVYAARAIRWRGWFSVHCWIATKEKDSDGYLVHQVTRWGLRRRGSVVSSEKDIPDRRWYGARPRLISELRGPSAEAAIPKVLAAVAAYPYPRLYRAWPGPNSNTFVSFILRRVPELGVELPPNAIGKDWIDDGALYGRTESGTGVQLSLFGLLGVSAGAGEGLEMNILGLNFGLDFARPALKLPIVGRIGVRDGPLVGPPAPRGSAAGTPATIPPR